MSNMPSCVKSEMVLVVGLSISIFSSMLASSYALEKMTSASEYSQATNLTHQLPLALRRTTATQYAITAIARIADIIAELENKHANVEKNANIPPSDVKSAYVLESMLEMSNNESKNHGKANSNYSSSCQTNVSNCFNHMNSVLDVHSETTSPEISLPAIIYNGSRDFPKIYHNDTVTTTRSVIKKLRVRPLVSDSTRTVISTYFDLVVNPLIGIIGLITNSISCVVIVHNGLEKPSNILLLSLAVSDWVCSLRTINIAWLLTYLRNKMALSYPGWEMPYAAGFICQVIDKTIVRLTNFAAGLSTSVTVLITIERFIATFFPLQFAIILTPWRAWIALISTAVLLLPPYLLKVFLNEYAYFYFPEFNTSMGSYMPSRFYTNSLEAMKLFELYFVIHFEFSLPLAIVITGCALISAKISYYRRKRQAMVQGFSKNTRVNARTTNTLLMVCMLYSLTRICYLFVYLPIFDDNNYVTRNVSYIFVDVRWTLVQVNSSCNIIVYVLFNPKFKRTLKHLFGIRSPVKGSCGNLE